jgi:hypothetical protein
MVFSCTATFTSDFFADSDALRIASETSFALPKPQPTFAELVTGHDQRAKAKAASAFNDLRAAINEDDFFRQI